MLRVIPPQHALWHWLTNSDGECPHCSKTDLKSKALLKRRKSANYVTLRPWTAQLA
jgi:hypothetical protein